MLWSLFDVEYNKESAVTPLHSRSVLVSHNLHPTIVLQLNPKDWISFLDLEIDINIDGVLWRHLSVLVWRFPHHFSAAYVCLFFFLKTSISDRWDTDHDRRNIDLTERFSICALNICSSASQQGVECDSSGTYRGSGTFLFNSSCNQMWINDCSLLKC